MVSETLGQGHDATILFFEMTVPPPLDNDLNETLLIRVYSMKYTKKCNLLCLPLLMLSFFLVGSDIIQL